MDIHIGFETMSCEWIITTENHFYPRLSMYGWSQKTILAEQRIKASKCNLVKHHFTDFFKGFAIEDICGTDER